MTSQVLHGWRRSTFGLAAMVGMALALATLAIGLVAYEVTHEALEHQLDQRTATETRALLAEPGADRTAALAAAIRRREVSRGGDHLLYALVDARGRRLAGSLDAAAPLTLGYREFLRYGDGNVAQSLTTAAAGGGRLVVAADRSILAETDHDLLILFAVAFGATSVLGAGGAWIVGAVTRTRLRRIDDAALAIIGGDLTRRMPRDGSDSEFDRLAATLNRMLDRISALMENLRQVSGDVAHDLRTPLTRLGNRLSEALGTGEGAVSRSAVAAAAAQAEELLEIFAALLRISEVEAMGVRRHFRRVGFDRVIQDLLEAYRPDFETSGRRLVDLIGDGIEVEGDRRLLQQALSNLLDNALRHTPAGTTTAVTLTVIDGDAVLRVADDGVGVAPDAAARLFERFSRIETSRSSDGHGLGLALVRAIAQAHRGDARILHERGFAVELTMPTAR